jgi:hypothetical protein
MEGCPLCRAMLNGVETCRRCKAELGSVQRIEHESRMLAGRAMYRLALGDATGSRRLLRLALDLHATPEVRTLWGLVAGVSGGESSPLTLPLRGSPALSPHGRERAGVRGHRPTILSNVELQG